MAKNRYQHEGRKIKMDVSDVNGTGADNQCKSGDPAVVGDLPGVCLWDEDADGFAVLDTSGVWLLDLTLAGALAPGENVFWDNAAGTLTDDATDAYFGKYVGEAPLAAGAHADQKVRVGRS